MPGLGRKCRLRASVSKVIRREHRGAFMRPSLSASLVILAVLRPMACLADDSNEWYGRVGALGAIYHSSATIATEAGAIGGLRGSRAHAPIQTRSASGPSLASSRESG